jgi:hypothetical protein
MTKPIFFKKKTMLNDKTKKENKQKKMMSTPVNFSNL